MRRIILAAVTAALLEEEERSGGAAVTILSENIMGATCANVCPVEELCAMLDDWRISRERDLSPEVWRFIKEQRFFGMIIPKRYGGLEFSAAAHAAVAHQDVGAGAQHQHPGPNRAEAVANPDVSPSVRSHARTPSLSAVECVLGFPPDAMEGIGEPGVILNLWRKYLRFVIFLALPSSFRRWNPAQGFPFRQAGC